MSPRLLLNHLGLDPSQPQALLLGSEEPSPWPYELSTARGEPVHRGVAEPVGRAWRGECLARITWGKLSEGPLVLRVAGSADALSFEAQRDLLASRTLPAVLEYFRRQRCGSPWDEADHSVGFFGGRSDRVDVHGGWYDASGDVSKYLSHLSYANYMNPQQTPIVVWGLLQHFETRGLSSHDPLGARLLAEARHGADFLCRMQDRAGYFYMTVFDRWSKRTEEREICAYRTQQGIKLDSYQAGYRQGGGAAIAALARAARLDEGLTPERRAEYAARARSGFAHLEQHNLAYLDDGKENIIDDYCALLAATELYALDGDPDVLTRARARALSLSQRVMRQGPVPGWFRADDAERPFYHAAEAGLPVVALLRFGEVEPDAELRRRYLETAEESLRFELAVTGEVDNPYGYARQYVQDARGERFTSFFMPHDNETGYWWQGENARLASLAAAAALYDRLAPGPRDDLRRALRSYAADQLDWICGRNPFDSCMLHGFGRNNVEYRSDWPNCPGGICNGITSGYDDETDIDFARTEGVEGDHGWRWQEQWLPHAAWYVIALAALTA